VLRFWIMLDAQRAPWWLHVLAGALIAAFFLQSFLASRIKSPSSDEPPHIAAGLSYIQKDVFVPNPQHPPLLKEMAAVSLLLAGIRLPDSPVANQMLVEPRGYQNEWSVGNDLIGHGGPRRVMFWARLPLILLSTLLGLLIYLWGRQMLGDAAAIGALFLCVLDPNLVAHSEFVTTDMGMTVFTTLFFFSLWRYLRRPGWARLLWCGLAMGMMLCAKFSAVLMVPVAALLMLAAAIRPPSTEEQSTGKRLALALVHFAVMCVVAALVIMVIYRSPSGLSGYRYGLGTVYADHKSDYLSFMAGQLQHRFASYFAVAFLLKEPFAALVAIVLGSAVLIRGRQLTGLDKLFVFLPPAVLFIACTLEAENIGIRYLIPAFPFFHLAGGAGLAWLIQSRSKWAIGLAAVLCVWIVVAAAAIYPDHLSYFNEAACLLQDPGELGWDGGTRCGPRWLDDSNVDWGQGLEQLRVWRSAHPDSRPIRMAAFGLFPPEYYGIIPEPVGGGDSNGRPYPGLYVISARFVGRVPLPWIRTIPPTAIVGHAMYVYDIR
jgi:hypothetical protein